MEAYTYGYPVPPAQPPPMPGMPPVLPPYGMPPPPPAPMPPHPWAVAAPAMPQPTAAVAPAPPIRPPPAPKPVPAEAAKQRTVFVTGFDERVSEGNIRELFLLAGRILSCTKQWDTKRRIFGYEVVYEKVAGAQTAQGLDGSELAGKRITVESVHPTPKAALALPPPAPLAAIPGVTVAPVPPPGGVTLQATLDAQAALGITGVPQAVPSSIMSDEDVLARKEAEDKYLNALESIARTVYVSGFEKTMSERKILAFFSPCGPIAHARIGELAGVTYAFLEFLDKQGTERALLLTGAEITPGHVIRVSRSNNAVMKSTPQLDERLQKRLSSVLARFQPKPAAADPPKARKRKRSSESSDSYHLDAQKKSPQRGSKGGERRRTAEKDRRRHRSRSGGRRRERSRERRRDSRERRRDRSRDRRRRRS